MVPCVKSALIVLQFHTVVLHEPGTSKAISLSWYNTQIKTWSFPYSPGYQSKTPDISETQSMAGMGRGTISGTIWKSSCIKLFIIYLS